MGLAGKAKILINRGLRGWGVRIESLEAERAERARLTDLDAAGQVGRAIFPVVELFEKCDPEEVLRRIPHYAGAMAAIDFATDPVGYRFANDYFSSPDAEVAYALVRDLRPGRIVEIGSGNSTRLFRAAIRDGSLATELVSIDPDPRCEVASVADRVLRRRLQEVREGELLEMLGVGDVLFIDSSHKVEAGSDVVVLLLNVLPVLKAGVIVHLHDIFLPFEYPREWLVERGWKWNEQYLVQAMLQDSRAFAAIWPGHYVQRTLPGFSSYFRPGSLGAGSSLWLRKCSP